MPELCERTEKKAIINIHKIVWSKTFADFALCEANGKEQISLFVITVVYNQF
jgi:hypothetical protein